MFYNFVSMFVGKSWNVNMALKHDKANLCVNSFLCLDAHCQQVFKQSESGRRQHVEHSHYQ